MQIRVEAAVAVILTLAFTAIAVAAEAPPPETLSRLETAAQFAERWSGTFVLTARATISKPDGADKEENVSVLRIAGGTGGGEAIEVLSATKDGKDVAAERRQELAKERAKRAKQEAKKEKQEKEDEDDDGVALTLPGPDTAAKFEFTALADRDGGCGARFAPRPEHAKEAGLTSGELRWDCTTLDPTVITARPAKNPPHVSEMSLRMEVARAGDTLYVGRTVTDGVGGVLFIKRRFHIETEIGDLRAPEAAPAAPDTGFSARP